MTEKKRLTNDEIYALSPSDLTPRQEFALLARMLHREGYNDGIAGHISYKLDDGTLLVNPLELAWDEIRARDVMHVSVTGEVLAGNWTISPAMVLHYALHAKRDVKVALHNHPEYCTIWSSFGKVPPIYDQNGAFMTQNIAFYPEYKGDVCDIDIARENVDAMGDTEVAILANHGVFILGKSVELVHLRAYALEHRAKVAWRVEALNREAKVIPEAAVNSVSNLIENDFGCWPGFYQAMIRKELRIDQSVLD